MQTMSQYSASLTLSYLWENKLWKQRWRFSFEVTMDFCCFQESHVILAVRFTNKYYTWNSNIL